MFGDEVFRSTDFFRKIAYNLVRVVSDLESGVTSTGTGFIYGFNSQADGRSVPALVTNKHVVNGATFTKLLFTKANTDGSPSLADHVVVDIENLWKSCIPHPDPKIDLAIYPLGRLIVEMQEKGTPIHINAINKSMLPDADQLERADAIEEVYVIGYPNGLYDRKNNKPIYRKGITASDIRLDYCGDPCFLVDAGIFPGSSGSPVFLHLKQTDKEGKYVTFRSNLVLAGIVSKVHQHKAKGIITGLADHQSPIEVSINIPNHLGIVIKIEKIAELEEIIKKLTISDS